MRDALGLGMAEGLGLALPAAVGLLVLGWPWSLGLLVGVAAVGVGRLVRWGLVGVLLREGGGGIAAGLAGVARHLLVTILAVGGVLAGLPPLAVAAGLLVPSVGRWIWTVRLARTAG